jgi:hypothetical protein
VLPSNFPAPLLCISSFSLLCEGKKQSESVGVMRGGNLMRVPVRFVMSPVRHRMAGAVIAD